MGSVCKAVHNLIDRCVANQFLLPEYARNKEMHRRFENEAKAAGRLEHNNAAAVMDIERVPGGSHRFS
jgi:serine/threonine-protein kinase